MIGMQGEVITKKFRLLVPSREKYSVQILKENFGSISDRLKVQPNSTTLDEDGEKINLILDIPEDQNPGVYEGELKVFERNSKLRVATIQVEVRVLKRLVEPLKLQETEIQEGGTFYRWYRTLPGTEIKINSKFLENSQPGPGGLFYVAINTSLLRSKLNLTYPCNLSVGIDGVVSKNGVFEKFNDDLGFNLTVTPRDYSTAWTMEREDSSSIGAIGSLKSSSTDEFTVEYNTDNRLRLVDRNRRGAGIGAGGSLFSAKIGPVDASLVGGGGSGKLNILYGISNTADFEESNASERAEAGLQMLAGFVSELKPIGSKIIELFLRNPTYMDREYESKGIEVETSGGADLVKASLGRGDEVRGDVAGFQVGGSGERKGAYIYRNFFDRNLETHSFKVDQAYRAGAWTEFLGDEIAKWGVGERIENEIRFYNFTGDRKILTDFIVKSNGTKSIYHLGDARGHRLHEVTLGKLNSENDVLLALSAWKSGLEDMAFQYRERIKENVVRKKVREANLKIPLKLGIGGVFISTTKGMKFSRANKFLAGEYVIMEGNRVPLKKYVSPPSEPLIKISKLTTHSLDPLLETDNYLKIITSSVKDGKLTFPGGTLSTEDSQKFLIASYPPANYSYYELNNTYLKTIASSEFAKSNVTQIQPLENDSFRGNITIDYLDGDPDSKLYRWSPDKSAWDPLEGLSSGGGKITAGVDKGGSYVVGADDEAPVLSGAVPRIFKDEVRFSVEIKDNGTGIDPSSLAVWIDDRKLNFTYSPVSGELEVYGKGSPGEHSIKIELSDTSGNRVSETYETEIIDTVKITNASMSVRGSDLSLDWGYVNGTYGLDHFMLFRGGEFLVNTTSTSYETDDLNSSLFGVYPIDREGFLGRGEAKFFELPKIIPRFTWDWKKYLRPQVGIPVNFSSSDTVVTNGTTGLGFMSRTWEIRNENSSLICSGEGMNTEYTFSSAGDYNITLKIEDRLGRVFSISKPIYISENRKSNISRNFSLDCNKRSISAAPGSNLVYRIDIRNTGSEEDIVNITQVKSAWPWSLSYGGTEFGTPFPSSNVSEFLLSPQEKLSVALVVEVPESGDDSTEIVVDFRSEGDPDIVKKLSLNASRITTVKERKTVSEKTDTGGSGGFTKNQTNPAGGDPDDSKTDGSNGTENESDDSDPELEVDSNVSTPEVSESSTGSFTASKTHLIGLFLIISAVSASLLMTKRLITNS